MTTFKTGKDIVDALNTFNTNKRVNEDKYDEEWASEPDKYTEDRVPTVSELMERREIIDSIYKNYNKMKKIDSDSAIDPRTWRDPPEYCSKDMLQGMHQLINESLVELKERVDERNNNSEGVSRYYLG